MQILDYIKPELLIVSIVLYFFSRMIKQSKLFDCHYIPLVNAVAGIFICGIYVVSVSPIDSGQKIAMALFTAITQGILISGISTYAYKIITDDGKIDLKAAFRSSDQSKTLKEDVLETIRQDIKGDLEEFKKDIGIETEPDDRSDAQTETVTDAQTSCEIVNEIKSELKADIKNELMSELSSEIINEISGDITGTAGTGNEGSLQ